MIRRIAIAVAALALGIGLVAPVPAFARMHFTDVNNRLDALVARANSAATATNPADIQTQLNEIVTLAGQVKADADAAAARPVSGAEDKAVMAKVSSDMDAIIADANKAKTATGADQQALLKGIQTKAQDASKAVKDRVTIQQQAPPASPAAQASPSMLPRSGAAAVGGLASSLVMLGAFFVAGGLGLLGLARLRRS